MLDLAPSFDTCGYFTRDGATFVRVGEVLLGEDSDPAAEPPGSLARDALPFSTRTCGGAYAGSRRVEACWAN